MSSVVTNGFLPAFVIIFYVKLCESIIINYILEHRVGHNKLHEFLTTEGLL